MYGPDLEDWVGDGVAVVDFKPGVKVGDPGVVFQDRAAVVEAPGYDLWVKKWVLELEH